MKKRFGLLCSSLLLLLTPALLASCTTDISGGGGEQGGGGSGGEGDGGGGGTPVTPPDPETPYDQTYYFFLDYSHSDSNNPFKKVKWWRNVPLGTVPEGCELTSDKASDPLFPVFLGWSEYSSSLDDSKLWNFATDYKATQVVYLYGIWVAND